MIRYIYDGSFESLITVVFEAFRTKEFPDDIVQEEKAQLSLIGRNISIQSDPIKVERVLEGLRKKGSNLSIERVYKAYLSEIPGVEMTIFNYIKQIVTSVDNQEENFANPYILKLSQITKQINREVHRMHAFVRFQKSTDDVYVATIEPDFNVIPLIGEHFENRYADQKWLIFDVKRHYGIYFDLKEVTEIISEGNDSISSTDINQNLLEEKELVYQSLWKKYFESVNIKERKNIKLHLQHVPKRYWKYLTEKK